MMDSIDYSALMHDAMIGVVRACLEDVEEYGLRGENHFYIPAVTTHGGVIIPDHLRARYPEAITIILQHQFSDLRVNDDGFGGTLRFGGKPERLYFPFEALINFRDPSEPMFSLQFEVMTSDPEVAEQASDTQPGNSSNADAEVISLDAFRNKPTT